VPSLVALALVALTISLGSWQIRRGEEKLDLARRLEEAAHAPVLAVPATPVDAASFEHRRVSVRGQYDPRIMFFLDNKIQDGVAGYHVLMPLRIEGGKVYVLVNRGWVAAGDRRHLPLVSAPAGVQTIEGVAAVPPRRFLELAPESPTGPLRENLVIEREQKRLGIQLQPFVIQQASDADDGLVRLWAPPDTGVERHRSYALQWYSLAGLIVVFYVLLSTERIRPGRD
jgi:surfeit locus 1 family protein